MHKFSEGDIVKSKSGTPYVVLWQTTKGDAPAYMVVGWRNGKNYGASRCLLEDTLVKTETQTA